MTQRKEITVRESKWKVKAEELSAFGWQLRGTEEYSTYTEGRDIDAEYDQYGKKYKVTIGPNEKHNVKNYVVLQLVRHTEDFRNLSIVYPLETLYTLFCILLKIVWWALIISFVATIVVFFVMKDAAKEDNLFNLCMALAPICLIVYLLLNGLKKLILRMAKSKLKRKQ